MSGADPRSSPLSEEGLSEAEETEFLWWVAGDWFAIQGDDSAAFDSWRHSAYLTETRRNGGEGSWG